MPVPGHAVIARKDLLDDARNWRGLGLGKDRVKPAFCSARVVRVSRQLPNSIQGLHCGLISGRCQFPGYAGQRFDWLLSSINRPAKMLKTTHEHSVLATTERLFQTGRPSACTRL